MLFEALKEAVKRQNEAKVINSSVVTLKQSARYGVFKGVEDVHRPPTRAAGDHP
jgi:hypothetical protein